MNRYEQFLQCLNCSSYQEFYSKLEHIAKNKMGLDGVPFPLSALEHPPNNADCPEIISFIIQCYKAATGDNSDTDAIKLIKYLKENPPKESYEDPKFPDGEPTRDDLYLIRHIFMYGIDLPGSKHNPNGHLQYFSSFFIDMYFGNYTEFDEHVKSLPRKERKKAMKKREGYCQYSPIFAPILGLKLVDIENKAWFTNEDKQKIRDMYNLNNENKNLEILLKLIKLGADVNAHDINGYTPLHYAVDYANEDMVTALLEHRADPNSLSRYRDMPLTLLSHVRTEKSMRMIDILIQHNANLIDKNNEIKTKKRINELRSNVEENGSKDLAVRVREAHPRDKDECEKCSKTAFKSQCGACGLVSYCTPACQKLDWKFHKVTCQKNKKKE